MLKTVTTCDRPPRIWPTSASDRLVILLTTLAEVMSSPTSRKNGIASRASESMPSKIFWTIAGNVTSVNAAPTNTPAMSENATGHAQVAEEQEQHRHHRQDQRRAHRPRSARALLIGVMASSSSGGSG